MTKSAAVREEVKDFMEKVSTKKVKENNWKFPSRPKNRILSRENPR